LGGFGLGLNFGLRVFRFNRLPGSFRTVCFLETGQGAMGLAVGSDDVAKKEVGRNRRLFSSAGTKPLARRPWPMAFRDELDLPPGLERPLDFVPLAREAARSFSVGGLGVIRMILSIRGWGGGPILWSRGREGW
jgi:hypothetical protein